MSESGARLGLCLGLGLAGTAGVHAITAILRTSAALRTPRGLDAALPQDSPSNVGAKALAEHAGGALNGGAVLSGNDGTRAVEPVPDVLLFQANLCSESSLTACVLDSLAQRFNGVFRCAHTPIKQHLFSGCQQLWFASVQRVL